MTEGIVTGLLLGELAPLLLAERYTQGANTNGVVFNPRYVFQLQLSLSVHNFGNKAKYFLLSFNFFLRLPFLSLTYASFSLSYKFSVRYICVFLISYNQLRQSLNKD